MISQTGLTVMYIIFYAWFCVGFVLIAFPAIKELFSMLFKKSPAKQHEEE